ncbi:hypothetical protein CEXT_468311 [Caerostris extrusa]|uniref:Uncharacterized protein n=1 Tax=Caerostris extrusa TaxID=172846 RepID=A0AAV4P4I8_CAEEX|nr:hypothetical protein CEXT_468311 [Caerostris extrusa]
MEESQTSMLLNEANGEIVENDVYMMESSTLSPENSPPETNSDLLTLKTTRPAASSASQEIDATIAKLGVPLAKLPTTPEQESSKLSLKEETRNLPTIPRLQQQQHTRTLAQSQSNRSNVKIASDPPLDNTRVRRSADKDGYIAPPRHLIARGTHHMPPPPDSKLDSNTNSFLYSD